MPPLLPPADCKGGCKGKPEYDTRADDTADVIKSRCALRAVAAARMRG